MCCVVTPVWVTQSIPRKKCIWQKVMYDCDQFRHALAISE